MRMRITEQMLENLADEINSITEQPDTPWTSISHNPLVKNGACIGNYHISGSHLYQISNNRGGVDRILDSSSKRELFDLMSAFIFGLKTAQDAFIGEYKMLDEAGSL